MYTRETVLVSRDCFFRKAKFKLISNTTVPKLSCFSSKIQSRSVSSFRNGTNYSSQQMDIGQNISSFKSVKIWKCIQNKLHLPHMNNVIL